MKQVKKNSGCGGQLFGFLISLGLILWGICLAGLGLFGETAPAYNIRVSKTFRYNNTRPTYYVSYSYSVNGKEYSGFTSSAGSVGNVKTVYYYSFLPYISVICGKDGPSMLAPLVLSCIGFFILFVTLRSKNQDNIEDTGEEGEEYEGENESEDYENKNKHKANRKNISAWQCECGRLNAQNFCTKCGKPRP